MLQWVIIGVVIWYFYRRYTVKKQKLQQRDSHYIHKRETSGTYYSEKDKRYHHYEDDTDYIDYEEIN